ncbi:2-dehydropantoate 2-reductase [soil metagenome]
MKICIYGAGAIGGLIGTRLAADPGNEVSAVARGATLAALRSHGWRLQIDGALEQAPVNATDDPSSLGVQDLVVVAVKGPAMAAVASNIAPLLGPDTVVMPAMNGVPWWFVAGLPDIGASPLEGVDPGGQIAASVAFDKVLGCVVHASTSTPEPGLVAHRIGRGLIIGEPLGGTSARAEAIERLLTNAGFDVTLSTNVRQDIWYKLWGNMTMNPVSAITGATIDKILADPLVTAFCSAAMSEASLIGARLGCAISESPEDRHVVTRKLGSFKTSMLQDVEAGRPIELDALVSVVSELARRVDVACPNIDALLGLTRLYGRVHGLYPQAAS